MYVEFENVEEIRDAATEALGKYVEAETISPAWNRLKIFNWRDMLALKGHIAELQSELQAIRKNHFVTFPRVHGGLDVYDLSPAMKEGVLKNKLIELGWTPPNETT